MYKVNVDLNDSVIVIESYEVFPFMEMEGFQKTGKGCTITFNKTNALLIRGFLAGKQFSLNVESKTLLKYVADEDLNEETVWSQKLFDLTSNKVTKKFGQIKTEWDLIHYLPLRYIDKSNPQKIDELELGQWAVVVGTIVNEPKYDYARNIVKIVIQDVAKKRISATFFRQKWLAFQYKIGDEVIMYGNYSEYVNHKGGRFPQITNAKIDKLNSAHGELPMIPIYPQKSGDKSWQLQKAIEELLNKTVWFEDPVPEGILKKYDLMSRNDAYRKIHFPANRDEADKARERIAFDDFIRLQVVLHNKRAEVDSHPSAEKPNMHLAEQYIASLPYELTDGQKEVIEDTRKDMSSSHPMVRLVQGDVGSGKAQPLYSKILTPNGFITMGEIKMNDIVLTPNGGQAKVAGIFPQGKRKVYELTFRDGTSVRADENHLWSVRTTTAKSRNKPHKLKTTNELLEDLNLKNGYPKWYIDFPRIEGLGHKWNSIIHPYLIGALLGDGGLSGDSIIFTCGEASKDIMNIINNLTPDYVTFTLHSIQVNKNTGNSVYNFRLNKKRETASINSFSSIISQENIDLLIDNGYSSLEISRHMNISRHALTGMTSKNLKEEYTERNKNPFVEELKKYNLMGVKSNTKFIPKDMLLSDEESRLALLQGLLDTDGSVEIGKAYSFSSVSLQLAEDVAFLARSLGGIARVTKKVRKSGISYLVYGRMPSEITPFRIKRKKDRYESMTNRIPASKAIVSIKYVGLEETQCIKLNNTEGLYITDDFTITHNTTVAAVALLISAGNGFQTALLAPTDILASQLYETITSGIIESGIELKIELLTGKTTAKNKALILHRLAEGELDAVVGTHTLIQDNVKFHNLGLLIVDEQHKFGAEQRSKLRVPDINGVLPDVLVMSATPIPRTTAQVIYGDMDISIISELPKGRLPIETHWLAEPREAWDAVKEQLKLGRQAYIITAMVEETESMENVANAEEVYQQAIKTFSEYNVGLVHGRLGKKDKEQAMHDFANNTTQVLVSTTVVEVGVNVPNATIIVILNANRFGIASLHQMRGRVGRSTYQSYCYLVGNATTPEAEERLNALVASNDGFYLAEKDLEIRGEGKLFGSEQSGGNELFIANLREHKPILDIAKRVAKGAASSSELQLEISKLYESKGILA